MSAALVGYKFSPNPWPIRWSLVRLQSSSLSPSLSPCWSSSYCSRRLFKIPKDNRRLWLQNQRLNSWDSALAERGRNGRARTNIGCFLVSGSRCRPRQARFRKNFWECYHSWNADLVRESKGLKLCKFWAVTTNCISHEKWNFELLRFFWSRNPWINCVEFMVKFFLLKHFSSFPTHSQSFSIWRARGCTNRFGSKCSQLVYRTAPLGWQARTRASAMINLCSVYVQARRNGWVVRVVYTASFFEIRWRQHRNHHLRRRFCDRGMALQSLRAA